MKKARLLAVFCVLCCGVTAKGQTEVARNTGVAELAGRLAQSLSDAGIKRVAVLDLRGPQREIHPAGSWLADQLCAALQTKAPELEVIDRATVRSYAVAYDDDPKTDGRKQAQAGHSFGADAVVSGSYAAMGQRLGITLLTINLTHGGKLVPAARGQTPLSDEIRGLSPNEIPTFKGEVFRAGMAGISNPKCVSCPNPEYTDEARRAHYQGNVLLEVNVTAEGRTEKISVAGAPGRGLEESAIRALKKWKFEPARDLDDKPVATRVPIEVTFRLQPGRP